MLWPTRKLAIAAISLVAIPSFSPNESLATAEKIVTGGLRCAHTTLGFREFDMVGLQRSQILESKHSTIARFPFPNDVVQDFLPLILRGGGSKNSTSKFVLEPEDGTEDPSLKGHVEISET